MDWLLLTIEAKWSIFIEFGDDEAAQRLIQARQHAQALLIRRPVHAYYRLGADHLGILQPSFSQRDTFIAGR